MYGSPVKLGKGCVLMRVCVCVRVFSRNVSVHLLVRVCVCARKCVCLCENKHVCKYTRIPT